MKTIQRIAVAAGLGAGLWLAPPGLLGQGPRIEISFPATAHEGPLTGRVLLAISRTDQPELRLQGSRQLFGVDAKELWPGQSVVIDGGTFGHPARSLRDLPAGDYYLQAFTYTYTRYPRADGHVIWGLDQWTGLRFAEQPGNLYSKVQKVSLGPKAPPLLRVSLTEAVPPVAEPRDTPWLKYLKLESKLLTKFWGRPIYLGAIVLLPRGYETDRNLSYPVIYDPRNHYLRTGPFDFQAEPVTETAAERKTRENLGYETGYEFSQAWSSDRLPRMVVVTMVYPTPFYDYATTMNSVGSGPFGDAIMTELIPYVESHFRIIREPYARVVVGKSSGGRDALALQVQHPDFFGGAWVFHPWSFDYSRYFTLDVYHDRNAFLVDSGGKTSERPDVRTLEGKTEITVRSWVANEFVVGGRTGVGAEWMGTDNALNSPLGPDGYPRHLFDPVTGVIDREVAAAWRSHDLTSYLETNWPTIGSRLAGKLHFSIGTMDEWFRDRGVRHLQEVLERVKNPASGGTFFYGPGKGHGWQEMTNAELVKLVAEYVAKRSPPGRSLVWKGR